MGLAANNRNEAIRTATSNAELRVAIELKRTWNQIRIAGLALRPPRTLPDNPTDADFQRMALEMIDQRQFTINGQTLSLADMDASEELAALRRERNLTTFQQLVPTRRQIGLIANEVGRGVYDNTGDIGFLRGATIGSALSGLFSWIFSGFRGGFQGLMDSIAGNTAGNMRHSVTNNLARLRYRLQGTEDNISNFLTDADIQNVGTSLQATVLNRANPNRPAPQGETLASIRIGDVGDSARTQVRNQIRTTIRSGIIEGLAGTEAFSDVLAPSGTETNTGFFAGAVRTAQNAVTSRLTSAVIGLSPAQRLTAANAVADGVADRLSSIIADPNYRYTGNAPHLQGLRDRPLSSMSQADKAKILAEEAKLVVEQLATQAQRGGDVRMAALYTKIAEQLPAQVEANILRQTNIPWFIAGQQNPGQSQGGQAQGGILSTLTPLSQDERKGRLTAILQIGLGPATEAGRRLQTMVGGPVGAQHFDVITGNASEAIDEINRRTAAGEIPASGEQRYLRISQLLRERFQNPDLIRRINNADPAHPLTITPEMMAVLADQMTGQLLGDAPNTPEFANYNASVARNRGAIAVSMIGPQIVSGLRENAATLQEAANGTPLADANYNAIAAATQPILAEYASDPAKLAALGPDAYRIISDRVRAALLANRDAINSNGVVLSDAVLNSMADDLTVNGVAGIVDANRGTNPPVVLPPMPQGEGSYSAQRDERKKLAAASIIARKLETTPSFQQLAGSANPLQPAAYQAIGNAAAPVMVKYLADPARATLRRSGPDAYQQVTAEFEAALAAGNINVGGANFNENTRRLLAQQMAVQVVEGLYPPGQAPARPEAFSASMATGATPLVTTQVRTQIGSEDTRALLASIGTLPANTATVAADDPALTTIINSASPVIARVMTNPPRLPDGKYDPAIYANLARDIRASFPATGITNAAGLSLSPEALDALANNMAIETVRNGLGRNAPEVPEDFAAIVARQRRDIISRRIESDLRSDKTLPILRRISGVPNMAADNPNITSIAGAVAPVFERNLATDQAKAAIRTQGPAAYEAITNDLLAAMPLATLNANGATFTEDGRRLLAQQMAIQLVESAYGPDQVPAARPVAFQTSTQTLATPVIAAELLAKIQGTPDLLKTLGDASGIANLQGNNPALPVLTRILAPAIAPLATNARNWRVGNGNPPTYRDSVYQDTADAIFRELDKAENVAALNTAGMRLSPEIRRAMANEMAVEAVQQQLGTRAPAIPAAFTAQRRTATQAVIQARVQAEMERLPADASNALTVQNDFNNVPFPTVARVAAETLVKYRYQSSDANNPGYGQVRYLPATAQQQEALELAIRLELRQKLVDAGFTNAVASTLSRSLAQNFVDQMPAQPGVATVARPASRPAVSVATTLRTQVNTEVAATATTVRTWLTAQANASPLIPSVAVPALVNTAMNQFNQDLFAQQVTTGMHNAINSPAWAGMNRTQRRAAMKSSITAALNAPYPGGRPGETYYEHTFPNGLYFDIPSTDVPAIVRVPVEPSWQNAWTGWALEPGYTTIGGGRVEISLTPAVLQNEIIDRVTDRIMGGIDSGNNTLSAAPQVNRDGLQVASANLGQMPTQDRLPNLNGGLPTLPGVRQT